MMPRVVPGMGLSTGRNRPLARAAGSKLPPSNKLISCRIRDREAVPLIMADDHSNTAGYYALKSGVVR